MYVYPFEALSNVSLIDDLQDGASMIWSSDAAEEFILSWSINSKGKFSV